jgi:hypothetical protein
LAGRDLGTARLEILTDLFTVVHPSRVKEADRLKGALRVHLSAGPSSMAEGLVS